jgi:diguanylate cyclase (GGDEF)-like protein
MMVDAQAAIAAPAPPALRSGWRGPGEQGGLAAWPLREPGEAFWVSHIRTSTVLYVLCNLAVWTYLVLTPDKPYRLMIFAVAVFGLLVAFVVDRYRRAIVGSCHCLRLLYAWSSLTYGLVTLISYLDGGASSPLCLLMFIALSYIALAYPPRAVLAFSALAVAVYLGLAAVASAGPAAVQLSASMIGLSGVLGAFAAANQWRQRSALADLAIRLERQAATDQLTGCLNRRTFHDRLAGRLERAGAAGSPVSLLFVDVDHFKAINDTYGHLAGDAVLAGIGSVLAGTPWVADAVAGRIGGDEFAVILPGADAVAAHDVGRLIRATVREQALSIPAGVTVSIGIGAFPTAAATLDELFDAADRSLYSVKGAGRDGVATVNPSEPAA